VDATEIGAVITGSAAFGGVIVGSGVAWLSNWASSRRQQTDARNERRRAAYVMLIDAAGELSRLLLANAIMNGSAAPDPNLVEKVARAADLVDRAYGGVLLVGPDKAQASAWEMAHEARQVLDQLSNPRPDLSVKDLALPDAQYTKACRRFVRIAREVLGDS